MMQFTLRLGCASALLLALLCGGCAMFRDPPPVSVGRLTAPSWQMVAPPMTPASFEPLPSLAAAPEAAPAAAAGEGESFTCSDGANVVLSYAAARDAVSVTVNQARPIVLRRDGAHDVTTYSGAGLDLLRAGPRLVLAPHQATVTVRPGDTLGAIAQRLYGVRTRAYDIARVNQLANPDLIYPGQVLQLPDARRQCRRV